MLIPETEILITSDGTSVLRKTLRPGDYVIGRGPECDVRIDVDLVSGRHAQLTVNYDHTLIEDLGSTNGTFVNGKPVTAAIRLWPNQKIQIGSATIELRRMKAAPSLDVSLAPQTATVRRMLPEEFLREKKYDIGGVIAQGGMGAILDAKEATTERTVAMKVMLDADTLEERWSFRAHDDDIMAMAFHPTLPILATAANDGTLKLWDYEKAHLRRTFLGIDGGPVMLAFSPNGRLLALEAQDHFVRLFDLATEPTLPPVAPVGTARAAGAARSLGVGHARAGRWAEARAPLAEAAQMDPEDTICAMQFAVVLDLLGDASAYRAHCHAFLARSADTTNPETAERAAKTCLLLPIDDADRAIAIELGHRSPALAPNSRSMTYFRFADGLAFYRAGDFAKAAEILAALGENGGSETRVQVAGVLAMAQARLGKTAEARAFLQRAEAIAAEKLLPPGSDLGGTWHDVMIARLLLKEAQDTIGGQ